MTDTTYKALDALQERLKEHDSHPESASAQADATIAALRAERDRWAVMVGRIVACLPLENINPETATMGELIDEIKDGLAERDALRAQLATAQKEIDRCHARLQIAYEWRSDETGKLVKAPVADPLKHPDAVHCRNVTIELMQDQIDILERRLATARADALREAAEVANEADSLELALHGPAKIVERILDLLPTLSACLAHPEVKALVEAAEQATDMLKNCTFQTMYMRGQYVDREEVVARAREAIARIKDAAP
jgi:uncharacterized coiled-coil protein SlyX